VAVVFRGWSFPRTTMRQVERTAIYLRCAASTGVQNGFPERGALYSAGMFTLRWHLGKLIAATPNG
jgi:hypothetical protein